jgi:hypothetical protein
MTMNRCATNLEVAEQPLNMHVTSLAVQLRKACAENQMDAQNTSAEVRSSLHSLLAAHVCGGPLADHIIVRRWRS